MPQNIVETPEIGETVLAPSAGDPVTDASVIQGEQPLANRLAQQEGFEIASGALELLQDFSGSGLAHWRLYARHAGSTVTIERTYNARWTGTQWKTDVAGFAMRWQFGGGGVAVGFASPSTTSGGWSDAEFNNDASLGIGFDPTHEVGLMGIAGGNLPASATPAPNTVYANNIAKAYANFRTDGAGGAVFDGDTFNVDETSVSVAGTTTILITLRRPFATAEDAIVVPMQPTGGRVVTAVADADPAVIALRVLDITSDTQMDLANTNGIRLGFVAYGKQ